MAGPDYGSWLARLPLEQDNVRMALRWLLDGDQLDRCAAILVFPQHWTFGGRVGEYLRWAREVLARDGGSLSRSARAGLLALCSPAVFGADRSQAVATADEGLLLARGTSDAWALALALLARGHVAMWMNDNESAHSLLAEAESCFRRAGDECFASVARAVNANVTMSLGRAEEAHRMLTELAAERRSETATWDLGVTLAYRGLVLIRLGAWDQAEQQVRVAITMVNHFGGSITMMYVLHYLCITAAHTGRLERSARLAGAITAFYDQLGPSMLDDDVAELSRLAVAEVTAQLGRDTFDALFREGRALTWGQAVRLAAGQSTA
jgi:hypothetical protein